MRRAFKSALIVVVMSLCLNSVFAQKFQDVFNPETPLTYLGIDFTNVKVIGHSEIEVQDLIEINFASINQRILDEPKKYDLTAAFHKTNIESDLSYVNTKNKSIEEKTITSASKADEKRFANTDIDKIIKGYSFNKKGIGVMFIMESMSKLSKRASMFITFIDMSSSKVLYTERMVEQTGGYGMRDYYAKSIYDALNDIEKKYKDWKKSNGL